MAEMGALDINELVAQLSESADLVMFQYFRNLNKRTIIINEGISDTVIECVCLPLMEMDNDGSGKEINILLNSVGGEVHNGLFLCDLISKLKTKTTITVMAYAYSMGSLIIMAGFNNPNVTVKCHYFTTALIHSGSTYLEGTTTQVKDYFKFSEKYEGKIKSYILSHTKITEEQYEKMSRYEWYMTSEEMLEFGLVDEIL